jgi:hypothetical protein
MVSTPWLLASRIVVSSDSSSLTVMFVYISIFSTRQVALQQPPLYPFSIFLSTSGYPNGCRFHASEPPFFFFIFDSEHPINIQSMPVTQDETALSRGPIPSHLRCQFQQILCMFLNVQGRRLQLNACFCLVSPQLLRFLLLYCH